MKKLLFSSLVVLVPLLIHPTAASATGFTLGGAANYVILYKGGSSGAQLSINNFGTPGNRVWTGNIGIAGVGKLAASGPGTLNGHFYFAAANTGQASISNTTYNGPAQYGVTAVQTAMNALNTLSSNLGALAGTALAINASSGNQTVLASSGTLGLGNRVFTVNSVSTANGKSLIIKGDGSRNVVLNVDTPGEAQFKGNILLQDLTGKLYGQAGYAGLTPDQLLINFKGADKLSANNQGDSAHPNNIMYGVFLNPNGEISFVNTRLVGRIFGGDSKNMQIVSGDTITQPTTQATPEPGTFLSLGIGLFAVGGLLRRRRASN
jgi:hypothetical protein